jgi:enoyl-CoA hydratase
MAESDVLYEVSDRIATITINRPEARNALTSEMLARIPQRMLDAEADDDVDVIILTGTDPAFTAGLDLKELGTDGSNLAGGSGADGSRNSYGVRGPFPTLTKPLIGAINGVAVTGGLEYALNCDFLVASERAKFGDTHSRVGVMPGWGLTVLLPQAIGIRRAREMSFTGNFMLADEALAFGLVNHVVPHADLIPFTRQLAARHHRQRSAGRAPDPRHLRPDRHRRRPLGDRVARQQGLASHQLQPRRRRRPPRRHPSPRPTAVRR